MASSMRLDDDLHDRLTRIAEEREQSPESIVGEIVGDYVRREEQRAAFVAEAEASWDRYQRNGLHLTGDEVYAWLGTWDKDQPPPACHD